MTSLLAGARRLVTRRSDLGARLVGLEHAVAAGRTRLPEDLLARAEGVVDRAGQRLRLSPDHTVVALAGATGSGKSSMFNALVGLDLAAVGVRRPTTSWTTACVWGEDGAEPLLDWLGIPPRHRVVRDSMLEPGGGGEAMRGTVLLDLPDHDSTEVSHHVEVDRLTALADLLVWVLDPQKYADAAVHRRYLAPLRTHADVMLVVLNHIDTVSPSRRDDVLADVRRLLAEDGLDGVPVLATSARHHTGIDALRSEIVRKVADKKAARTRLEADLRVVATEMEGASGTAAARELSAERVRALDDAVADAAGVPTVVAAVRASTSARAGRATGWPLVAWLSRLRPDPLRRLHLDLGAEGRLLTGTARTSVPEATRVQRARVDTEVRALADDVSAGLTRPWASAVRASSVSRLDDLGDRLDAALGATDLGSQEVPGWARLVRVVQWALMAAVLAGVVWLGVLAGMAYLRLPEPVTPDVRGLPLPTLLVVGGVIAGLLLALLGRVLVGLLARRRARVAERRLREAISAVTSELVAAPVRAELAAHAEVREGLVTALR